MIKKRGAVLAAVVLMLSVAVSELELYKRRGGGAARRQSGRDWQDAGRSKTC